jgi:hypothetical protein
VATHFFHDWLIQPAAAGAVAHPHMLRHACGYALANKGHHTRAIQDSLGRRSITSTAALAGGGAGGFASGSRALICLCSSPCPEAAFTWACPQGRRRKLNQRPRRFSTCLRLLPTFFTAFFTAAAERLVFFASYRTSWLCPPATRARSCLRPRAVFFVVAIGLLLWNVWRLSNAIGFQRFRKFTSAPARSDHEAIEIHSDPAVWKCLRRFRQDFFVRVAARNMGENKLLDVARRRQLRGFGRR